MTNKTHPNRSLTIGVTAVGSGVGQAIVSSLKGSFLDLRIVGFEASAWSKGIYECDEAYLLPWVYEPAYRSALLDRCKGSGVDLLLPGSDSELIVLSELAAELSAIGCKVVVSSPESVRVCRDKLLLFETLSAQDAPFAFTWPLDEARAKRQSLPYPLVIKGRSGSGSLGVRLMFQQSDWDCFDDFGRPDSWVVQPYLMAAGSNITGVSPNSLRDQLCPGGRILQLDEISAQVLVSTEGAVLGRFVALTALKDGVVMRIDPFEDAIVTAAIDKVLSVLLPLGLQGPFNLQGRHTSEGIRFFEANPRFTGITHARSLLGYKEVEATVRYFALEQPESLVNRTLKTSPRRIGLRQITETVIPRRRLTQLADSGILDNDTDLERILITGATGYLGRALTAALLSNNPTLEVVAPVRDPDRASEMWRDNPFPDRLHFVRWEIPEPAPDLGNIDLVIHTAAVRPGISAEPPPWYPINVLSTLSLVDAVRRAHTPYLIYVSSQSVYGTRQPPLWREDVTTLCPETPYAHSKAAAEAVVQGLTGSLTRWAIFRLGRIYGLCPQMRWDELVHRFVKLATSGKPIPVHGDGLQRMDLLHIHDATTVFLKVLHAPQVSWNQTFNVGSGEPVAVTDLARTCVELTRARFAASSSISHQPTTQPLPSFGMDITRAKKELGWVPEVSLQEGISELIDYLAGNRDQSILDQGSLN